MLVSARHTDWTKLRRWPSPLIKMIKYCRTFIFRWRLWPSPPFVAFTSHGGFYLPWWPSPPMVTLTSQGGPHLPWWPSPPMVALTSHGGPHIRQEKGGDHRGRRPWKKTVREWAFVKKYVEEGEVFSLLAKIIMQYIQHPKKAWQNCFMISVDVGSILCNLTQLWALEI